jgi:acyl-CoA synthetase (AMP-forming)/AMP-acid ligase II
MHRLDKVMVSISGFVFCCCQDIQLTTRLGLTETATTVSYLPPGRKMGTIGSAGVLIPGVVAKVVKPDGSLAAEGEPGELVVTGPSMAMGYYENPTACVKRHLVISGCLIQCMLVTERQKLLSMAGCGQGTKSLSKILKCSFLIE